MPKYAVINHRTGQVRAVQEILDIYVELTEAEVVALEAAGNQMWHKGGHFVCAPTLVLTMPKDIVAGHPFTPALTVPKDVSEAWLVSETVPDRLELWIDGMNPENNRPLKYNPALPVMIPLPGEYCFKVVGPAPWTSNQVRFTVAVPAAPVTCSNCEHYDPDIHICIALGGKLVLLDTDPMKERHPGCPLNEGVA